MAKKKAENPQEPPVASKPKIVLKKYVLKEALVTDKGVILKGDKVELSAEGARLLKQQNKI